LPEAYAQRALAIDIINQGKTAGQVAVPSATNAVEIATQNLIKQARAAADYSSNRAVTNPQFRPPSIDNQIRNNPNLPPYLSRLSSQAVNALNPQRIGVPFIPHNQPMKVEGRDISDFARSLYQSQAQPPAYYNAPITYNSINPATVSFSLLNTKEFTISSDNGYVGRDILLTIRKFPVKVDERKQRLVFPIEAHDRLLSALGQHKVFVEPLPRQTIAAAMLQNQRKSVSSTSDNFVTLAEKIPESVMNCLAPFQKEGVEFALKNQGRMLLADEMGLGKTRSAIASAVLYQEDWPVLVVSPSSARHHWQAELMNLLSPAIIEAKDILLLESASQAIPLVDETSSKFPFSFVIVSYGLIDKLMDKLSEIKFNVVIADESHYLKNPRAKRTKRLVPFIISSKRAILISGTPALSRPIELFTQLHALDPSTWSNEKTYGKRYCKMKRGSKIGFGQEYKGASNTHELHVILTSTLMIRRLKIDILRQLPKKQRRIVKVEVQDDQKREHFK
jgi:hypothetical protein